MATAIPISVFILTSFMREIPNEIEESAQIDGCNRFQMFFRIILPLAVWEFQVQYSMNTPMIMSVLTLTVIPMILLFIFMQDKLIKGMTAGAIKG